MGVQKEGQGICEKCGRVLQVGDWPFCGGRHAHGRMTLQVVPDDIPGGETIENLAPEPITFYSRSEKRDYLRAHGIREQVRHVGTPGSDKSPHTSRWV